MKELYFSSTSQVSPILGMLCRPEKSSYGYPFSYVGETQCCGSREIWLENNYITPEYILSLIKNIYSAIYVLHGIYNDGWLDNTDSVSIEEYLNAVSTAWQVKIEEIDETTLLVVLNILDRDAYIKWRNQ